MLEQGIKERLEKAEYKLTQQRKAVLEVMQNKRGEHLTAEEVLYEARQKVPHLGIATVYRTLERLAAIEVLYKTIFDEGKYRYELSDQAEHQHLHILCIACSRIFEVEEGLLDSLEKHLEKDGFEIVNHQLKIYAYCPECSRK
ncbi:MAG: transcriptional repressor [Firmicutes bacterium HGW-Firmicutes-15]|nr:MAG: transcriptional repressor [Firmicutes bacterium HGW-Firmicutes-15]